jgi:hypothetical protein
MQTSTVTLVVSETDIYGVYSRRNRALTVAQDLKRAYSIDAQVIDWMVNENKQFNLPTGEWL